MPTAATKTYIVTRNADNSEFEVQADRVERDPQTAYVNFYIGDSLVASQVNVAFRLKTA